MYYQCHPADITSPCLSSSPSSAVPWATALAATSPLLSHWLWATANKQGRATRS